MFNLKKGLLIASLVAGSLLTASVANAYPSVPQPIAEGGGAIIGDTVYVGLGAKAADNFYSLDLAKPNAAWKTLAKFPGGERKQPVVAAVGKDIYVFGGLQVKNGVLQLINDAWKYDPSTNKWSQLPTRAPIGLVGTNSFVRDGKIFFIGGSNTPIFNGIFADLNSVKFLPKDQQSAAKTAILDAYFNKPYQDYFFNRTLVSYDPATNSWSNLGQEPFPGRAGAGVAVNGNHFVVVGGEIKPGLRTSRVEEGVFFQGKPVQYIGLPNLSNTGATSSVDADGLAGPYVGWLDGKLVVAGGANFPGAMKAYNMGNYYSHKGLPKTYYAGVFALDNGQWTKVGSLPEGMGYGVTIPYKGELLVISGELNGKKVTDKVYTLSLKDGKVVVK